LIPISIKEIVGSRTTRVAKATTGSYNIPEKYPEETYDTTLLQIW